MDENIITVFCDGGTRGNQFDENIGGYGIILEYKGNVKEMYSGELNTTNNIQELKAVINALLAIKTTNIPVVIHSDSAYVVNGMNSWIDGWKKRGWKKSNKKPVENKELWVELDRLSSLQEDIKFVKVKGHVGIELNERADRLANLAMDELEV